MAKITLPLQFLGSPVWWPYIQPVWWPYIQSVWRPYIQPVWWQYIQPVWWPYIQPMWWPYIQPVWWPYIQPVWWPYIQPVWWCCRYIGPVCIQSVCRDKRQSDAIHLLLHCTKKRIIYRNSLRTPFIKILLPSFSERLESLCAGRLRY